MAGQQLLQINSAAEARGQTRLAAGIEQGWPPALGRAGGGLRG
jgi:hypothetical protein